MRQPPRPGEVVRVDGAASVQFSGPRAIWVRIISVSRKPTYHGWCWCTGYVLDATGGQATEKREIFVQVAGLRLAAPRTPVAAVEHRNERTRRQPSTTRRPQAARDAP
ncbi:hypothetical protein ACN28C_21355 [Plantactinospora sp. WMMC1484]|uniref:hypothetical protein n=1 Tax=Plantactinospora sp. WMMC1484 TaxID=3404122 RepID=UPI003BF54156